MKIWQIALLVLAVVAVGSCGWWLFSDSDRKAASSDSLVLRSRRTIRAAKASKGKFEMRIPNSPARRPEAAKDGELAKWNPFEDDKSDFDMDFDFGLELGGEAIAEMSKAVQDVLDRIGKAQAKFDRKGILSSVRQLLAMIARGEAVSAQAKIQAIGALQFAGGGINETLPELAQFAADENPEVAKASLEALQEMLWDFDTTSQQIADAIGQLVKLTNDPNILNPFVFEMADMPTALKVSTSLVILDSQNDAAIAALDENKSFVFDDFDGKVQTREDIVLYGKDHKDE